MKRMKIIIKPAKMSRLIARTSHNVLGTWYWCDEMEFKGSGKHWYRWTRMTLNEEAMAKGGTL